MPDLLSTILGLVSLEKLEIKEIPIRDILPSPHQPREEFDQKSLQELAQSIKQVGVIQPIVVRQRGSKYQLIVGERRLRASKIAGLTKIPAVIRKLTDEESLELTLIENLQREDLNPIEEAKVYLKLIQELKLTQREVAEKVGKSPKFISDMLKLIRLPDKIKEDVSRETISKGHCFAILQLPTPELQLKVAEEIKLKALSVKQTETLVKRLLKSSEVKEPKEFSKEVLENISILKKVLSSLKRGKNIEFSKKESEEFIEINIKIPKKMKKLKKTEEKVFQEVENVLQNNLSS
jgi:ParB family chromosome partitioning protein